MQSELKTFRHDSCCSEKTNLSDTATRNNYCENFNRETINRQNCDVICKKNNNVCTKKRQKNVTVFIY